MSAKIRVASDDSYRDLTNLLSKSQKHAAFEAEILANHSRVVDFKKQAESLIEEGHFASIEIQNHVENLESLWERLMNATNFKKERLREAYDVRVYFILYYCFNLSVLRNCWWISKRASKGSL